MNRMEQYARVCAHIDLDAVHHNLEAMRSHISKQTKILGVIKADGYGHGAIPIARAIESEQAIWGFGVATAEEAQEAMETILAANVIETNGGDLVEIVEARMRVTQVTILK